MSESKIEHRQRPVVSVIEAHRQTEGGGFVVRRPFPTAEIDNLDPFLLLDEMGPTDYGPGEAIGAPITRTAGSRRSHTCSTAQWSTATPRAPTA